MPSDALAVADYGYDTVRDICRIGTALWTLGSLFLPLCFFGHARRRKDKSLPGFLKELQGQSWRTAIMLFRRRWWHIPFFAAAFGALSYLPCFFPAAAESEVITEVSEYGFRLLYPLLSFSYLWCLPEQLRSDQKSQLVVSTPSVFFTFLWTLAVLTFSKGSAEFFGLLAMFYVLLAVRADLTLALVFTRSMNPVSAMWKSFQYSRERALQFAWTFSMLSGLAYFLIFAFGIAVVTAELFADYLKFEFNTNWQLGMSSLHYSLLASVLSFIDCLFLSRGILFLQHIEGESKAEGGAAASGSPVAPSA